MAADKTPAVPIDPELPNYHHPDLVTYLERLQLVSDLLEGTERMHDQARTRGYIRKWEKEDEGTYLIRSRIEQVFGGLRRVLSAAVGMLFAKPAQMDWGTAEAAWEDFWGNVDAAGSSGPVFLKRFTEAATQEGVALLIVDHPGPLMDSDGELLPTTSGVQAGFNLRPHWAWYSRRSIVHWRTGNVNNTNQLTALGLWEPTAIDTGLYGVIQVDQYRTMLLNAEGKAEWTLWQVKPDTQGLEIDDYELVDEGVFTSKSGEVATFLPVAVAHTGKTDGMMVASIPLMDVAWANLGHWQEATDLRFYRAVSSFGQPVVIGELTQEKNSAGDMVAGELALGPLVVVHMEEGGSFSWEAPPSETFKPLQDGLDKKEAHMAVLGMSFLSRQTRAPETAEARRLDAVAENSSLATVAQAIDDAVDTLFQHTAWFRGEDRESAPRHKLNRDFDALSMDPQVMAVYVQAVKDAGLPPRLLLEQWQQGGRIPLDANLDEIEMEMMAFIAAREDEERMGGGPQFVTG